MANLTTLLHLLLACLTTFATAYTNATCEFPVTVPGTGGCSGCVKTAFQETTTKSIDCQGCGTVSTMTEEWKFEPVCRRYVCVGGITTTTAPVDVKTTVTSCLTTPTPLGA